MTEQEREIERLRTLLHLSELSCSALQNKVKAINLVSKSRLRRINAQARTILDLRKEVPNPRKQRYNPDE